MYCSKCGKEIDYDALVCRECEQAEQQAALAEAPAEEPILTCGNTRKRGFGVALAGCIVGFTATLISVIVYVAGLVSVLSAFEGGADIGRMAVLILFFELLAIVPAIIAIVKGVRAVKIFKATPSELPKPIATLVVGIHAIFFGGFAILYSGIFVFILMMMLLMPV
jgi:hypothetical protein